MSKFKALLLDVDGVLILPPRPFSNIYCEKYGKDLDILVPFYSSKEFKDASIGKMDLKEAITAHQDKWQWHGDVAELINEWLGAENYPNRELLTLISELRQSGTKVYIVTQQEEYRAAFLKIKIFAGHYDGFLVSCDLGLHKDTPEFWRRITDVIDEKPADLIYFDDKQKLVDLAKGAGIDAHVYTSVEDIKQLVG